VVGYTNLTMAGLSLRGESVFDHPRFLAEALCLHGKLSTNHRHILDPNLVRDIQFAERSFDDCGTGSTRVSKPPKGRLTIARLTGDTNFVKPH
jgi:hypothetical protein